MKIAVQAEGPDKPSAISVISLRAKALDAELDRLLMVTDASITEEARRLASEYNIRLVPSTASAGSLRRELATLGSHSASPVVRALA